jgi:EmrB/QacA subfamily drug resistance transporter
VSVVLAVLVVTQVLFGIDATVISVAMPSIGADLGLGVVGQSWLQTSYVVAFGGLLLLGGRVGDRLGRRRTLQLGVLLFAIGSLAGGLAPSGTVLVTSRVLQGVGAALAGPNVMALLLVTHPEGAARVRAIGVFSAVLGAGATIGLILGGVLTTTAGWRWGLLINPPIALVVVVLAARVLPETPRHTGRLDLAGIATSAAGLGLLVVGLARGGEDGWTAWSTLAALAAAAVLLVAFVLVERRTTEPALPLELVLHRVRGNGYVGALLAAGGTFASVFLLTQLLQTVLGFDALAAGLAFVPMMLGQLALARIAPAVIGRTGPTPPAVGGALLTTAALLWLRFGGQDSYGALVVPLIMIGVGGGLAFVPLSTMVLGRVPGHLAGAASGALQVAQYTGTALGVAVATAVYAASAATGNATALHVAMLGAAAFTLLAAVCALLGRPTAAAGRAQAPEPRRVGA